LTTTAALTFYLDVDVTLQTAARLARAVVGATSLEHANQTLNRLGVRTELDRETEAAGTSDAR